MSKVKVFLVFLISVVFCLVGINSCQIGSHFYAVNSALQKAERLLSDQKERISTIDTARLKFDGGIGKTIADTAKSFTGSVGNFLNWIADANQQSASQKAMSDKLAEVEKAVSALVAAKESKAEAEVRMKDLEAEIDKAILEIKHLRDGMPSSFWQWVLFFLSLVATVLVWVDFICFKPVTPAPATRGRRRP